MQGTKRISQATDVLQLIRVQKRLRIIESLIFNSKQSNLLRWHDANFLDGRIQDSSDGEFKGLQNISLIGFKVETEMDKKVIDSILPPPPEDVSKATATESALITNEDTTMMQVSHQKAFIDPQYYSTNQPDIYIGASQEESIFRTNGI